MDDRFVAEMDADEDGSNDTAESLHEYQMILVYTALDHRLRG